MKLRSIRNILLSLPLLAGCGGEEAYTPKPHGYFRIGLPDKEYRNLDIDCNYTFEYNKAARWEPTQKECWGDVYYPTLKARLQLTYKPVTAYNLDTLLGDARELAFKHTVKADGIKEDLILGKEKEVYGILYRIRGEAATNVQFFVTDSTENFLRGVLYFYAEPNEDSLQPVNDYMYEEVAHLIETLEWRNSSP